MVATGSRAIVPPPLAGVNPWTSREATSAHAVPGRLAVVGGGVVGCEMAAAWAALGARGTLLGITRGTERSHVVRAVLEGIAQRGADTVAAQAADEHLVAAG